ncbi:MAG TPA: TIGR00725 family protein [Actinomycetota bacterium]|jgi:hypothetical protein
MTSRCIYVAVCGPDPASEHVAAQCETIGRLLAREGAVVVCGGLGGAMEAVARGCAQESGTSIGILPGPNRVGANPHLSFVIPTGMGEARNALVARSADVVIAVAGEFGTLSEIAIALKMGVPVVGLDTWELSKAGAVSNEIVRASTPEEAVAAALRLAAGAGAAER